MNVQLLASREDIAGLNISRFINADLQKRIEDSGAESIDFQEAKKQVETVIMKLIENNFLSTTKKFFIKTSEWNKASIIKTVL